MTAASIRTGCERIGALQRRSHESAGVDAVITMLSGVAV